MTRGRGSLVQSPLSHLWKTFWSLERQIQFYFERSMVGAVMFP